MQRNSHSKFPEKIALFFFITVLISSCHIEKRRYLPGFYKTSSHAFSKESDKKINSQILDFSKSKLSGNSVVSSFSNKDSIKEKPVLHVVNNNNLIEKKKLSRVEHSDIQIEAKQLPRQESPTFSRKNITLKLPKFKNHTQSRNSNINYGNSPWWEDWAIWWNLLLVTFVATPVIGWLCAKWWTKIKERDPLGFIMCYALLLLALNVFSGIFYLALALYLASISLVFCKFYGINITKKLMPFFYKN